MIRRTSWVIAVTLGFATAAAPTLFAQSPQEPVRVRPQPVPAARYGDILGLPRDRDKLYLPDETYPRFPLPPGNEAYAHVDGRNMKKVVEEITAISRKSRDEGNQYWGRIPGTPYDRMTADWVA